MRKTRPENQPMRFRFIVIVSIVSAALACAAPARAEIVSAGPSGFNLRHVAEVPNPAPVVWAALADIGKWWDPEHTYSGDSRNLTLEPFVRGCFCEKLSLYAGIEHASVIYALPAKTLRLSGALGPLQEFGVSGVMTWNIEPPPDARQCRRRNQAPWASTASSTCWCPKKRSRRAPRRRITRSCRRPRTSMR
jgi:hypothetical protein